MLYFSNKVLEQSLWELRPITYIWRHIHNNLSNGMVNTYVYCSTHQDNLYISKVFYNLKIVRFCLFSAFHSQLQDLVIGFSIVIRYTYNHCWLHIFHLFRFLLFDVQALLPHSQFCSQVLEPGESTTKNMHIMIDT